MSSVYATEPATSGRVVFDTTHGPLEIQLWCRECPTTTKLFLQLCLDGFYDNMLFHRIVPKFLIQTGAMRIPNIDIDGQKLEAYRLNVKADYALERRKYELHSRLKFGHRGQVAMALGVTDDADAELQPQFLITLDEASFLDGKHILFGTVAGPTFFNAARIGEVDVEDNQPTDLEHAPRVRSVRIVDNPVHVDIFPQVIIPWRLAMVDKIKKRKRKGKLNINVLSFGDEIDDTVAVVGIRSSHDVGESQKLSKKLDPVVQETLQQSAMKEMTRAPTTNIETHDSGKEEVRFPPAKDAPAPSPVPPLSLPRKPHDEGLTMIKPAAEKVSLVEERRSKYFKGPKNKREREDDTMTKLFAFQNKVKDKISARKSAGSKKRDDSLASRMARRAADEQKKADGVSETETYHGQILESDDEGQAGKEWLQTKFKCRRHMDHGNLEAVVGGDGRKMDDYEVVDERSSNGHRKHHAKHR